MQDIVVPVINGTRVLGAGQPPINQNANGFAYAAAGFELLTLTADGSTNTVANRFDLSTLRAFQFRQTLKLIDEHREVFSLPYGLGTFQARQLLLPSPQQDVLIIIGSAVNAAPVVPGPSPIVYVGDPYPKNGQKRQFYHPNMRPFESTVILKVNISEPLNPRIESVSEHEGLFVGARDGGGDAWVFLRTSVNLRKGHEEAQDAALSDDDVMPRYRRIDWTSDSQWEPWKAVGSCSDVRHLDLGIQSEQLEFILAAVPIPLTANATTDSAAEGSRMRQHLFVQGWSSQVRRLRNTTCQPVFPAAS
jgi:hypothetical protein